MAAHSSIFAWRILWTEGPGRQATVHGITELDRTEHASTHMFYNAKLKTCKLVVGFVFMMLYYE